MARRQEGLVHADMLVRLGMGPNRYNSFMAASDIKHYTDILRYGS
jgi:hypothetical protein